MFLAINFTYSEYTARRRDKASSNRPIIRSNYAAALYKDDGATLDDLFMAITTLEDTARTARRVLGGAHPLATGIETSLREARAALRARETPSASAA